jgi:autophagy-related protein 16
MAYSSLEGSLRRLQEDNQELVSRWMALKARDADRVNEENAQFQREKQEKLRMDLQRAALEDVGPLTPR